MCVAFKLPKVHKGRNESRIIRSFVYTIAYSGQNHSIDMWNLSNRGTDMLTGHPTSFSWLYKRQQSTQYIVDIQLQMAHLCLVRGSDQTFAPNKMWSNFEGIDRIKFSILLNSTLLFGLMSW